MSIVTILLVLFIISLASVPAYCSIKSCAHKKNSKNAFKSTSEVFITAIQRPPYVIIENNSPSKPTMPYIYYEGDEVGEQHLDLSKQKWSRHYRLNFIRKVYSIFSAQLLCTVIVTALIMTKPNLQQALLLNFRTVSIVSFLGSLGLISALSVRSVRQKSPLNLVLLGAFTLLQSVSVGTFSSLFDPRTVCLAGMHTLFAFLAITLYSFQPDPKYDLTAMGNTMLAALTALMAGTILNIFFRMPLMANILAGLLAVMFAAYIARDTQMIVGKYLTRYVLILPNLLCFIGGKSKKKYSTDDYILAALDLYQDVISLFIQILKILGKSNRKQE